MKINDALLSRSEKVIFALEELYLGAGYGQYRMDKFEEYDLYANNKDFLVSDRVITFTDTDGALMALKPDVTLSIIKNISDLPDVTQKLFYRENVYRVAGGTDGFREIMQTGLECVGKVGSEEVAEVISLAAESMRTVSRNCSLALSDIDVTSALVSMMKLAKNSEKRVWDAVGGKDTGTIVRLGEESGSPAAAELLARLIMLRGSAASVLAQAKELLAGTDAEPALGRFAATVSPVIGSDADGIFSVDFSVTDDTNYYNGIVFKGFVSGIPQAVLSGGQYDRLMLSMKRRSRAVGFAVYADALDRTDARGADDGFINVALPKGRLGEKVYSLFESAGYGCGEPIWQSRKLVFENPEKKLRFFLVKPSDVAIYVERGAADVGVAGLDVLNEYEPDVYTLSDLKTGVCRMAVAAKNGYADDPSKVLRVATKYPETAKKHYRSKGRSIDVIKLNGSIELAPILGLADVIVDIVETGATLRENDLSVIEEIAPVSAVLIANKAAVKFRSERINTVADALGGVIK